MRGQGGSLTRGLLKIVTAARGFLLDINPPYPVRQSPSFPPLLSPASPQPGGRHDHTHTRPVHQLLLRRSPRRPLLHGHPHQSVHPMVHDRARLPLRPRSRHRVYRRQLLLNCRAGPPRRHPRARRHHHRRARGQHHLRVPSAAASNPAAPRSRIQTRPAAGDPGWRGSPEVLPAMLKKHSAADWQREIAVLVSTTFLLVVSVWEFCEGVKAAPTAGTRCFSKSSPPRSASARRSCCSSWSTCAPSPARKPPTWSGAPPPAAHTLTPRARRCSSRPPTRREWRDRLLTIESPHSPFRSGSRGGPCSRS